MFEVNRRCRRRRLLGLLPCVAVVVAVLGAAPAPPARGAPARGPALRLPAATDPAVVSLARDQGIPIRAAQRRLAWQERSGQLSKELQRTLEDRFGGVWIDQAGGGRIKVATTAPGAATQARAAAARLGIGAAVDLVPVRHPYHHLYLVSDILGAKVVRANAGAPAPLVTGLATDRNAVVLTLPRGRALTPGQQRFVAEARRAYGTAVVLERSAVAYTGRRQACRYEPDFGLACDPPLRGGLSIDKPQTALRYDCSAGFITRSRSDSKPYLLTAGHCGSATWSTHFTDGSSHVIGTTWGAPRDDSEGDYQIVTINKPGADGWAIRAWVYVSSSLGHPGVLGTTYDPDYYISADGGSSVGDRVCHTGGQELTDCGTVSRLNVTTPWGLRHTGETNYCAFAGDSGGPVFVGHVARGIHIGGVEGCGVHWFQGVQAAENDLNVNVAHGS